MEHRGCDKGIFVGVNAASSTLGNIIPPSITMVVYAGIANVSTGSLFFAGILPGMVLGLAMMGVVILILTALLPGIVIGFPRLLDPDMFP